MMLVVNIQFLQILIKLGVVDGLRENSIVLETIFLRDGKNESKDWLVNRNLRNAMWRFQRSVVHRSDGFCGEETLIEVYDMMIAELKVLYLVLYSQTPCLVFSFFLWVYKFYQLYSFAFDFMQMVNFAQESRIDPMIAKMAMKQDTALFQGLRSPEIQGFR